MMRLIRDIECSKEETQLYPEESSYLPVISKVSLDPSPFACRALLADPVRSRARSSSFPQ